MKITVKPKMTVEVQPGETLLELMLREKLPVENLCNGQGSCGKCKVRIFSGVPEPGAKEIQLLSPEEISRGVRLACQVYPQEGMIIQPETGEFHSYNRKEDSLVESGVTEPLSPGVRKVAVSLPRPTLQDETGDWERLYGVLASQGISVNIQPAGTLLRQLPQALRAQEFTATAVLRKGRIIAVEPGDTRADFFGVALDIGTTGVAAALVDLNTGKIVGVSSEENAQTTYGADVISRIAYAKNAPENGKRLQAAIRGTVNRLIRGICAQTGVNSDNLYKMTVVGNTTMHHLFLGLDTGSLGVSPFTAVVTGPLAFAASELGININPGGEILMLPNIAGFVGGDTLGAILGSPRVLEAGCHLLVDIGTNCELFLKTNDMLFACSTAAGPALEGARITQGMRAKPGAIEGVRLTGQDVEVRVIGGTQPVGICGSGLIEAIAEMRRTGIIRKKGALEDGEQSGLPEFLRNRLREGRHGHEFVLAYGRDGSTDIVINQKDISEVQLAKGAICASIKTLLELAGMKQSDLDSLVLSGTFASYLQPESLIEIGLLPKVAPEKVILAGNAAHGGALKALLNEEVYWQAGKLAGKIRHIELGGHKLFNNYFMKCLGLNTIN